MGTFLTAKTKYDQKVMATNIQLHLNKKKKANQAHYRPEVPRGFQEVKVPRLRDNGPGWW